MNIEREFTIRGKIYRSTHQEFEERVAAVKPNRIYKYWVKIGERAYPVKQAVAVGLRVPPAAFQSQEAFRVLQNLGFEPVEGTVGNEDQV